MCRLATIIGFGVVSMAPLLAQVPAQAQAQALALPDWQRVGSTVIDRSLASAAAGPVDRVWYSPDGSSLYAKTPAGRVWATSDFETWRPAPAVEAPDRAARGAGPDGASLVTATPRGARLYAAGRFAYRSDDGGLNWTNLTQNGPTSILGGPLVDAAASPRNPDEIVVAGSDGLWRSLDGGESWTGMNDGFPNLPVQRILSAASGDGGVRILSGELELVWRGGERVAWRPAQDSVLMQENLWRTAASAALGVNVTAIAGVGDLLYAGSEDGLLYFSRDRGAHWGASGLVEGAGRIERIRIDREDANIAVAVTRSRSRGRALRTSTGGVFWEDLTGNLPPDVFARGIVQDHSTSALYLATDKGVYFAYSNGGERSWTLIHAGSAADVALDDTGNQLYTTIDDSGVFAAMAPHRLRDPKVVSAADRIARAAAPGSLLSVMGARVQAARIGERNAPVLAASDTESQIQVPFDASGTNVQLAADTTAGARQLGLTLLPASPSIFVDRDGVPLVLNADSGLVLEPGTPARSGARLQILATGLGRVRPEWPTGLAAPLENAPRVVTPVRAYLDREPIEVTRATLAPGYIGMYLVEVQMPSIVNRGTAELYIEAQDQPSNRVRIFLEP